MTMRELNLLFVTLGFGALLYVFLNNVTFIWAQEQPSRIVFTSNRDGNYERYVMNADGSNQARLANTPGAWSPDGQRIAFASERDDPDPDNCSRKCNFEIYVMNADGTDPTRLTNNPAMDIFPTWLPASIFVEAFEANSEEETVDVSSNTTTQSPVTIPQSGGVLAFSSSKTIILISTVIVFLLFFAGVNQRWRREA